MLLMDVGTAKWHQSHGDVTGPVGQSADHADFRFAGCAAQRGPSKTRQQRNRANPRRRFWADAFATKPAS